jgi:murein DD-endopeptidase MepM/ murein hydrolase activator NlpD
MVLGAGMGGRRFRLVVCVIVGLALGIAGAGISARSSSASESESLRQQLRTIKTKTSRVENKLAAVRRQQRQVTRQLTRLDGRVNQSETRLQQVARDRAELDADLRQTRQACHEADRRLSGRRDMVADRLVAIYEQGDVSPLEVLLESESFDDFNNRMYLLDQVVARDTEVLAGYEAALNMAEERRRELDERQLQLAQVQQREQQEKEAASRERESTARQKVALLRDQATYERQLAEMEQDSREITAMLRRRDQNRGGGQPEVSPWRGGLMRPVPGGITSGYGYRRHPIYKVRKKHTGVDMTASHGTPIKAAADGVVVHASRWGGYGNCVIIDHGGGLATLYAHCSTLNVSVGSKVKQGGVIAKAGSTGLSTGPHLHFEVRRGGDPVDPSGVF